MAVIPNITSFFLLPNEFKKKSYKLMSHITFAEIKGKARAFVVFSAVLT